MPFFGKQSSKGGGDGASRDAADSSTAGGSMPGNSDTSAHSNQPLFRESAAPGSVMSIEASLRASQRPPRSLVIVDLARASVDLARDLAREFVEPPVQTSTLTRRHVSRTTGAGSVIAGDEIGAAKAKAGAAGAAAAAAAADLESAPSGGEGSSTKPHVRKTLTPLELEGMPKGTCEDGIRRRGTTFSATMHVITAIIGAGVLSLPAAMVPLGYAGGSICFLLFGLITLYTAHLLSDTYCINGLRQRTYTALVDTVFGRKGEIAVAWIQLVNLILTAWPYQILGAKTMAALAKEACGAFGKADSCPMDKYFIMCLIFGAIQLPFSMVPSLEHLEWASVVGTVASAIYSAAAFGLSASKFGKGPVLGSAWGSPEADAWTQLSAVGTILFSLSFAYILVEIQDTLHGDGTPRGPIRPMKRACNWAIGSSLAVYYAVACAGYSVFGDTDANVLGKKMPDDILTGFDGPRWIILVSNAAVLIHMMPAYQVWSQPFFEYFEHWRDRKAELTGRDPLRLSAMQFRFFLRTSYVVAGTLVTCAIPSLSIILGLAGALAFWPATVLFPIEAYVRVFRPRPAVKNALRSLNVICCLLTIAVAVSGVQQIVTQASQFKIFRE